MFGRIFESKKNSENAVIKKLEKTFENISTEGDPKTSELVKNVMMSPLYLEALHFMGMDDFFQEYLETKPREISRSRKYFKYKYVLIRKTLMWILIVAGVCYPLIPQMFVSLKPLSLTFYFLTILYAFSLLSEVMSKAGTILEREYQVGMKEKEFFRTFEIVPSIKNAYQLLFISMVGLYCLPVFFRFSFFSAESFVGSISIDQAGFVYESLKLYYQDVLSLGNKSSLGGLGSLNILLHSIFGILIIPFFVGIVLSWALEAFKNSRENPVRKLKSEMERKEELMKKHKVGKYADEYSTKSKMNMFKGIFLSGEFAGLYSPKVSDSLFRNCLELFGVELDLIHVAMTKAHLKFSKFTKAQECISEVKRINPDNKELPVLESALAFFQNNVEKFDQCFMVIDEDVFKGHLIILRIVSFLADHEKGLQPSFDEASVWWEKLKDYKNYKNINNFHELKIVFPAMEAEVRDRHMEFIKGVEIVE